MSFLGSLITAGTVQPSVLSGIFSYQSHCFSVFILFLFFIFISNYSITLYSGADWRIIDELPVF